MDNDPQDGVCVKAAYASRHVPIPDGLLINDPADARPITMRVIDWETTDLPQYAGRYAAVLDHVLSPSECAALLGLVEDSVADRGASGTRTWRPALVNVGGGMEMRDTEYRNSDRIVWDNQEVVDRLWARCATVPGIPEQFAEVVEPARKKGAKDRRWRFSCVNARMRFLKYSQGQFFRRESLSLSLFAHSCMSEQQTAHSDGAFSQEKDGKIYRTFYTLHLYLNDSCAEVEGAELVGGATPFLSHDHTRRVDVHPRAGRVLLFQHKGLYHSGDDVVEGTKYTMRSDILYELQSEE